MLRLADEHSLESREDGARLFGRHGLQDFTRAIMHHQSVTSTPPQAAQAVPEGCTPADARTLRSANHALAQESHELQDALADLYGQVKRFCEADREADFETGRALWLLSLLRPLEFVWPFVDPPLAASQQVDQP